MLSYDENKTAGNRLLQLTVNLTWTGLQLFGAGGNDKKGHACSRIDCFELLFWVAGWG